jgi:hypothetical protein
VRTTETRKQSETAQCSLFAQDCSTQQGLIMGRIVQLSGPQRTDESLVSVEGALFRSSDPRTSRSAAKKAIQFKARHIAKIWNCLKDNGKLNYKEIAKLTGLEPVAVARRRKEMERDGLIEVLGEERNGCQLWVGL